MSAVNPRAASGTKIRVMPSIIWRMLNSGLSTTLPSLRFCGEGPFALNVLFVICHVICQSPILMSILGVLATKIIPPYIAPPTCEWAYIVMLLLLPIFLLEGIGQYSNVFFHKAVGRLIR